jgi:hypothetical protein
MKLLKSLLNLREAQKNQDYLLELSIQQLAKYKKAAADDAKMADAEGDFERGNKRFRGINRATKKQFSLATKKIDQKTKLENK